MRLVLVAMALVTVMTVAAVAASDQHDDIVWVQADGGRGWSTSIARGLPAAGTKTTALVAPTWFAKLPDGKIPLASSGTFDTASARGSVLLVDYWASWCTPCLQELPHLQKLFETRSARGLKVLAINVDEDGPTAAESAKRLGLGMPIGLFEKDFNAQLGVTQLKLPTILIVDRQGRMRGRWNGYRVGDENDIARLVDQMLAPDDATPGRSLADVTLGAGRMKALWFRDLPGTVDGVVGLPPGQASGARAVASAGGSLTTFDAEGSKVAQAAASSWAGKLLDFGPADDGSRRIAGFRIGGQSIGIVSFPSGATHEITVPAPIVDLAVEGEGASRRLAVVTTGGALLADGDGSPPAPISGTEGVQDVAAAPGYGMLALRADGSIGRLGAEGSWPGKTEGAGRLLMAKTEGAVTAPRTAIAAAHGRFLDGPGRQLAIATYSGRLVLLDAADGKMLFEAAWPDLHDLATADLNGDGFDELLVAAGHSIAALSGR